MELKWKKRTKKNPQLYVFLQFSFETTFNFLDDNVLFIKEFDSFETFSFLFKCIYSSQFEIQAITYRYRKPLMYMHNTAVWNKGKLSRSMFRESFTEI